MPEWENLPLLSSRVAQSGVADAAGNFIGGAGIEAASGNIDPRISDFVLYGVFNGAFARGPQNPAEDISDINPLPDWAGPTQVSGGAITCQWVVDASSPSGYNLRFNIAAGAAGDEAYFEQIVPIGGSRAQQTGDIPRATALRVAITGAGAPKVKLDAAYLTAAGVVTGADPFTSAAQALASGAITLVSVAGISAPPADAEALRIRLGVARNTMAAADTATVDLTDVRREFAHSFVIVADGNLGTAPQSIYAAAGTLVLTGALSSSASSVFIDDAPLTISEQAAPSTPTSGYYAIYPKTDGILYGKNDSGTEVPLGGGGTATVIRPSIAGTVNNWAPTGLAAGCLILADLGGSNRTITGISALADGAMLYVMAQSSTNTITFTHLDAGSSAANQFRLPGGVSYVVGNKAGVAVVYDATDTKWRVVGPA